MILEEIPLLAGYSDQTADIVVDGQPFTIRVQWNTRFEYWSLTIRERDGDDLLTNIKMVINYPLTGRFKKLGLDGDFYFLHKGGKSYRPGFDDLGSGTYGLFYYNAEEAPNLPTPLLPLT